MVLWPNPGLVMTLSQDVKGQGASLGLAFLPNLEESGDSLPQVALFVWFASYEMFFMSETSKDFLYTAYIYICPLVETPEIGADRASWGKVPHL